MLGDDEYRQKMVNDAMNRRPLNNGDNNKKNKKKLSEWEIDDDDNKNKNKNTKFNIQTNQLTDEQIRKQKFLNKRKAHYNEFHAIKAWRAKQQNKDLDE